MFQARKNPDGSITMPLRQDDYNLPPGVLIDAEVTVFPDSPNYAAAEEYLEATSDPFGGPSTGDQEPGGQ